MSVRNLFLAAWLLAGTGCNYRNPDQHIIYDTIPSAETSQVKLSVPDLVYSGKIPCADCGGILTTLRLIPDSMTYRMKEIYLNTGEGDKVFESAGVYAVNKGTIQDTAATVYLLNPGDAEKSRAYKLENDSSIRVLDRNLNEINSTLNYSLLKIADSTSLN